LAFCLVVLKPLDIISPRFEYLAKVLLHGLVNASGKGHEICSQEHCSHVHCSKELFIT
jgi:hypothetical protein